MPVDPGRAAEVERSVRAMVRCSFETDLHPVTIAMEEWELAPTIERAVNAEFVSFLNARFFDGKLPKDAVIVQPNWQSLREINDGRDNLIINLDIAKLLTDYATALQAQEEKVLRAHAE